MGKHNIKWCQVEIEEQFDSIKKLKNGWYHGDCSAFDAKLIDTIKISLKYILNDNHFIPTPYIYPTANNEISIEWPSKFFEIDLIFDLSKSIVILYVCSNDEINETYFDMQEFIESNEQKNYVIDIIGKYQNKDF